MLFFFPVFYSMSMRAYVGFYYSPDNTFTLLLFSVDLVLCVFWAIHAAGQRSALDGGKRSDCICSSSCNLMVSGEWPLCLRSQQTLSILLCH